MGDDSARSASISFYFILFLAARTMRTQIIRRHTTKEKCSKGAERESATCVCLEHERNVRGEREISNEYIEKS
jgi:hypothetical protein